MNEQNLSWDEAEKLQAELSPYFKPEINREYIVGFDRYTLAKKDVAKFGEDGQVIEGEKIPAVILSLHISELDGKAADLFWDVRSATLKDRFKGFAKDGMIEAFYFRIKRSPKGTSRFSEVHVDPTKPKMSSAPVALNPLVSQVG